MKTITTWLTLFAVAGAMAQGTGTTQGQNGGATPPLTAEEKARLEQQRQDALKMRQDIIDAELNGIEVRVKDVSRFRGVRSNQLQGIGLVVGLNGTGDSRNTPFTATLLANAMKEKTQVDPLLLKPKNVAVVFVTAELPAFATPGNRIDITVTSAGDAKSLQGGYLLRTPLFAANSDEIAYAVGMGSVSIGGFNVSSSGSSVQKNHTTVGRLPEGGIVEAAVDTEIVFDGGFLYLELHDADFTTAQRMAEAINAAHMEYAAMAQDAGTVRVNLPIGKSTIQAVAELEGIRFKSDTAASVVINENTGTIVMGGNVRIGPAVVAKGSLTVRIDQEYLISQPGPFSRGETVVLPVAGVGAQEETAQVTVMGPTTTVADLARIFQALKVSATDMIAILEGLRSQGALKARIKVQ